MNINTSGLSFQGKVPVRKLVPASQLQGLRLQLTETESAQVKDLEKRIAAMTENFKAMSKKANRRKYSSERETQIKNELTKQQNMISSLQELVRKIKINRFAEQKRAAGIDVNV